MPGRTLVGLLLLFFAPVTSASLEWETRERTVYPTASEEKIAAPFHFTNTGQTTVTLGTPQSGCGCVATILDKSTFAPGEGGTVLAVYTRDGSSGVLTKTVTISTDDPQESTVVLTLNVDLTRDYTVSDRQVLWPPQEELDVRYLTLSFPETAPAEVLSASSSHGLLSASVETVTQGREYRVAVTPQGSPGEESIVGTLGVQVEGFDQPVMFQTVLMPRPYASE